MRQQEVYDALMGEAFGFMREWEIERLTDLQIENRFAANRRRLAELQARHPEVYGAPEGEKKEPAVPKTGGGVRGAIARGERPDREVLVKMLMQMPHFTRTVAEEQADDQLAQWDATRGAP